MQCFLSPEGDRKNGGCRGCVKFLGMAKDRHGRPAKSFLKVHFQKKLKCGELFGKTFGRRGIAENFARIGVYPILDSLYFLVGVSGKVCAFGQ